LEEKENQEHLKQYIEKYKKSKGKFKPNDNSKLVTISLLEDKSKARGRNASGQNEEAIEYGL
jgi:hypothetical protein